MDLVRGDIVICAISGDYGKPRPAVIVQSDLFNSTHASITICPITSHLIETPLFRLLILPNQKNGLLQASQIMVDKIITILRSKIDRKIGVLSDAEYIDLNRALKCWLGLEG